jgi:hypothetical protein
MPLAMTSSTANRNLLNGFSGAVSNARCGRLCERSIARDAPDCLLMMSRENAHHSAFRVTSGFTF